MKTQQQQQAREMYFRTTLSKTEIAEKLGVSRRSVFQWSVEGDWEKLRASARCMPSMLAEKCYYLIGHFTDHLLSKESFYQSVTRADADILFKLTRTVNLLKQGSTINENMETFTAFLHGVQQKDAALAQAILPYTDDFISSRAATNPSSFMLSGHNKDGFKPLSEKEIEEKMLDEKEAGDILREANSENVVPQNAPASGSTAQTAMPDCTNLSPTPANTLTERQQYEATMAAVYQPTSHLADDISRKAAFWQSYAKEKARKDARKQNKAA